MGEHNPEGAVTMGEETEAVPKTAWQEVGQRVNIQAWPSPIVHLLLVPTTG